MQTFIQRRVGARLLANCWRHGLAAFSRNYLILVSFRLTVCRWDVGLKSQIIRHF